MRKLSWQSKLAIAAALTAYLGACVALRDPGKNAKVHRGVKFDHTLHETQGMECMDCHQMDSPETTLPTHELCGICHDIPEDQPDPELCGLCHTEKDYAVLPRTPILSKEVIFDHAPHLAAETSCTACHPDPNKMTLPQVPLMAMCMECHAQTDNPALNECSTCHRELSLETVPKFRGDARLLHDAPLVWEKIHGRESMVDPQFCNMCHQNEEDCTACHRTNKPDSHNVTWRRKTHGLHAAWDRNKCAVCHEEDSCIKCHENTTPRSHRGGFGSPRANHCVQCHFPPENNNCTVCHERIEHDAASVSPHSIGLFPPNCAQCHPGGQPSRAPHPTNLTTRCSDCHA